MQKYWFDFVKLISYIHRHRYLLLNCEIKWHCLPLIIIVLYCWCYWDSNHKFEIYTHRFTIHSLSLSASADDFYSPCSFDFSVAFSSCLLTVVGLAFFWAGINYLENIYILFNYHVFTFFKECSHQSLRRCIHGKVEEQCQRNHHDQVTKEFINLYGSRKFYNCSKSIQNDHEMEKII